MPLWLNFNQERMKVVSKRRLPLGRFVGVRGLADEFQGGVDEAAVWSMSVEGATIVPRGIPIENAPKGWVP